MDSNLGCDFNKDEVVRMIKVAILCISPSPALRPTMSAVVSMLEGRSIVHEVDPSSYGDELRLTAVTEQSDQVAQCGSSEPESLVNSTNEKHSAHDLYKVNPEMETVPGHDLYEINLECLNNSNISSSVSSGAACS